MNRSVDLIKGNVFKSLVIFSLPFLFSNLFQQLYNTIDTYIAGNTLNEGSLAAIGACAAIFELLVGFAVGVGNGMSVVTAKYYGAGDKEMVRKSIASSFIIAVIVTVVMMIGSIFGLYPLLRVLKTPSDIIDEAYSYISVIALFVGVMLSYNLFSGILKAMGNSFMPLIFLIISTAINVVLDYIFIAVANMGIRGAAVATVIAEFTSAVLCMIYLFKKYREYLPGRKDFRYDGRLSGELWAQGLAMGFMSSIVSIGTVILQSSINKLGKHIIAGHTAARKIMAFSTLPITTVGLSITTFVSQNVGAEKPDRVRKGIRYGCIITTVWSVIALIILELLSPVFVKFLSGSDVDTVVTTGVNYLKFNVLFYIPLGILITLRCSLQGMGKKILPILSSVIELFGKVIFTFAVIPHMGYNGVIICEPVVWCAMAVYLVIAYIKAVPKSCPEA